MLWLMLDAALFVTLVLVMVILAKKDGWQQRQQQEQRAACLLREAARFKIRSLSNAASPLQQKHQSVPQGSKEA